MINPDLIHEGMGVRCADGVRLGTVVGVGEAHFQVERGLFGQRDYLVDFSDVAHVAGRHILLDKRSETFKRLDEDAGGCVPPRGALDHAIDSEPNYADMTGY